MLRTRRWNDPVEAGDGTRVLVCRYRPRGVKRADEPWDEWVPDLGPSRALHADYYAEAGLAWDEYARRYLAEMRAPKPQLFIRALARRLAAGESITLLCSSACADEARCHRTLLKRLIEEAPAG